MVALGKLLELRRNTLGLECVVEHLAVGHGHDRVGPGVGQERGRRLVGHLLFVGEQLHEFGCWSWPEQVPAGATVGLLAHGDHRIDKHHEIRPAALPLHRICGLLVAGVEVRSGR